MSLIDRGPGLISFIGDQHRTPQSQRNGFALAVLRSIGCPDQDVQQLLSPVLETAFQHLVDLATAGANWIEVNTRQNYKGVPRKAVRLRLGISGSAFPRHSFVAPSPAKYGLEALLAVLRIRHAEIRCSKCPPKN